MGKKASAATTKAYRCLVGFSATMTREERSFSCAPGLIVNEAQHQELIEKFGAAAEWFEAVESIEADGNAPSASQGEASTESEAGE